MSRWRKRPVVIEAITFDEMIELGKSQEAALYGANPVPWVIEYCGVNITHETDDCYLIPTLEGVHQMRRGDMLITGVAGELYPCKSAIFSATYERVDEGEVSP